MSFLNKLFSTDHITPLQPAVAEINGLEPEFEQKAQGELRGMTEAWKAELKEAAAEVHESEDAQEDARRLKRVINTKLDAILPRAFAAVREAAKRTLGQRHFDAQMLGGMILHQGKISEMRTGEGKTLAATLAVYLNALAGRGVHIVTVNDYLARRDASWMGQVYNYLGLSIGVIQHDTSFKYQVEKKEEASVESKALVAEAVKVELDVRNLTPCSRREAYHCDITYGTNNEYGFDYLRDNMVQDLEQKVQGELYYAIVDEVDSILIDEARTPLIISAPDTSPTDEYYQFSKLVKQLVAEEDYKVDEKKKSATLTEPGVAKLEKLLGVENIYVEKGVATIHHIEQALRAQSLFKLDRDYVVRGGEVVIVDEFTGRLLPGRRYSEGLHQAIEAKEGVEVQKESKTLATITFQNYFRLYKKIAGMTGTASTEAEEFQKIYGLDPVEIPTNKPMIRKDFEDAVFKTETGKYQALVAEIRKRYEIGQPVLIGTVSIEKNEMVSGILAKAGIPHQMLNAKNHENEAKIIAQAGRAKAVTLATNIAGRGVDILLGGTPYDEQKAMEVKGFGGLHVLGTERHESRRIDNQLRGRSGRQGDPGSSQFFVSLEDDLIRLFGGDRVQRMMTSLGIPDDMPIEHGMVSRIIEQAQKKIEGLNFDIRKHVLEFDDVMNKHREVIYRIRDRVLQPETELKEELLNKIDAEIDGIVGSNLANDEGVEGLVKSLSAIFPVDPSRIEELKAVQKGSADPAAKLARDMYEQKERQLGAEVMRQIERAVMLQSIDSLWMEHLDTMDHLRDSVRLRGYAQRDPLIEYKREGFGLFQTLLADIDRQVVYSIFKIELRPQPPTSIMGQFAVNSSAPQGQKSPGRNDPCPCGSGKKYKKCGMINTPEHQTSMKKGSASDFEQKIGG